MTKIIRPAEVLRNSVSRRTVLTGIGAAVGSAALHAPFIRPSYAQSGTLRVSNFGGFFEEAFAKDVYPAFTAATGIPVRSIPQASGAEFLVQLAQANAAGAAPMDVCCAGQVEFFRGQEQGLWRPWDEAKIPNLPNLPATYVGAGSGGLEGVGAMAWYITMIANPDAFDALPDSWTELWESRPAAWGLQGGGSSVMLDIAAATYFGGTSILDTQEGIDQVIAKIAELKPNVKIWWQDEGTMQTAFQNDEVMGGLYYHDVAMIMADTGVPLASIFPKEGGVLGFNYWCLPTASQMTEEAHAFADWTLTPECHQLMARFVGCAPLLDRAMLDLTDDEFGRVSSASPPIVLYAAPKVKFADYLNEQFLRMMTA